MNSKLKILTLVAALVLVLTASIALADGSAWTGEVIARQITMREGAKSNAKSIGSIKNGESFTIVDDNHRGWFHIQYDGKDGYVMSDYVVENADHMILLSSANVYAFPHSDKRVAALSSYTRLTIIDEYDGYYVVNLREASGFIHKRDVDALFDSDIPTMHVKGRVQIDKEDTTPRVGPSSNLAAATHDVHAGETYDFVDMDGDWYIIAVDGVLGFIWSQTCHEI
jgi:SH3 domain protein